MTDALGLLSAFSFITIQPGNYFITLHRLVYLATRNWARKEEQFAAYIKKAADRLNETFPKDEHTNRQLWREYLPHALSLLGEREFHEQQEQYIDYMQDVGSCLYSDGRYNEAEELEVQVMETRKQVLGPEHPDTLTSMTNLAYTWKSLGNIQDALAMMNKCVELRNKVLGSDHPDSVHPDSMSSCNALANWETAENCSSAQETRQDSPALRVHTQSPHQIDLDSIPLTQAVERTSTKSTEKEALGAVQFEKAWVSRLPSQ